VSDNEKDKFKSVSDDFDDSDDFLDWLPSGQFTDMSKKSSAKQLVIDNKYGTVTRSSKIKNSLSDELDEAATDFDDFDDDFDFDSSQTHTPDENDFSIFEERERDKIKVTPKQKQKVYSNVKVSERFTDDEDDDIISPPKKKFKVTFAEEDDFFEPEPPVKKKEKKPLFSAVYEQPVQEKSKPKKRKKRLFKYVFRSVVAIVLIITIVFFSVGSILLKDIKHQDVVHDWNDTVASAAPRWQLADYGRYYNVLLIGADASLEKTARSDTMIIVSIDRLGGQIKLASLLRDTYVEIPGYGSNRLNATFAFGGAPLLMKTIESNFRIKIDKFISVDFDSLEGIVDSMGGVNMEITDAEAKYINRYSERGTKTLTGGTQHLNGNEAMHYARIRKLDSDFGRTSRQRKLIQQLVKECRELGVSELFNVVECVSPYITTNMSNNQIMWFGVQGVAFSAKEMEQISIPVENGYQSKTINGMSVLVPNLEQNCTQLHNFLFGKLPLSLDETEQ